MRHVAEREPRWEHNLGVVAGWDRYHWMSWYLQATADRGAATTEPLRFESRADRDAEINKLYKFALENVRRPMREGIADALSSWNTAHYSYDVLIALSYIAATLEAPEALPKLLHILHVHHRLCTSRDQDEVLVAERLVSVIGGYPSDPIVEARFSELLFDNKVAPELTALLALYICKSSPHRFAECFNRYYERHEEAYFNDADIVAQFADLVPSETRNPQMPMLVFRAYELWMQAGKKAEVVDSYEIVPPDAEGRPNAVDVSIPPRGERSYEEGKSRHDVAFDGVEEILEELAIEAV